ncbi:MAG: class I SAM-dependent methyltransferase [Methylocystaceae bacterium]
MNRKISRLEDPERLKELNPVGTLKRIGLGEHDVVCDIGAGSGIFTIPAAKITDNLVFALETDEEMLEVVGQKVRNEKLLNVKTVKVADGHFDIEENTVDFVILAAILHEIGNKAAFLAEINRIMKRNGKLALIEYKQQAPIGPPLIYRISQDEVTRLGEGCGMVRSDEINLGDNFYCIVFDV